MGFLDFVKLYTYTELKVVSQHLGTLAFALCVQLIFSLGFADEVDSHGMAKVLIVQLSVSILLALQVSYPRLGDPETSDDARSLLILAARSFEGWFLARCLATFSLSGLIFFANLVFALVFLGVELTLETTLSLVTIYLAALVGLGFLGVTLSVLMATSNARTLLFSILYFPLAVPVFIGLVEGGQQIIEDQVGLDALCLSWLGLILIFDVIYGVLGLLFFETALKADL